MLSTSIYSEYFKRKFLEPKNVFICYRGATRIGGFIANTIFNNILISKYDELSPFFAPVCNDYVNFENASLHAIQSSKVFIVVITEDFCVADVPSNDQIRKELIMLARKMRAGEHIEILPVMVNIPIGGMRRNGKKLRVGSPDVFSQLESWLLEDEEANLTIWKSLVLNDINRVFPNKEADLTVWESHILDKIGRGTSDKKRNLEILESLLKENDSAMDKELSDIISSALRELTNRIKLLSDKCKIDEGGSFKTFISSVVDATEKLYRNRQEISDGYVWVGTRLSDMDDVTDKNFKGAVTLFGKTDEKNNLFAMCDEQSNRRVDHNAISAEQDEFIFNAVCKIAEQNPKVQFYFYNQGAYYNVKKQDYTGRYVSLSEAVKKSRCIGVNNQSVINELNDKKLFHETYNQVGKGRGLLDVIAAKYHDCSYDKLCTKFNVGTNDGCKFIIQEKIASGGNGTYIMTRQNETKLRTEYLKESSDYLVSIYRENNVPVNLHAIIFDDGVLFTPGSIQVMRVDYESIDGSGELRKLMYRGADFIEYRRISELPNSSENKVNGSHIERFKQLCVELCEDIKKKGYRGVLGIDGMIYDDKVRILEVNCRFQASTGLINRALKEGGFPSIQEINVAAVNNGSMTEYADCFKNLTVGYSNYSYNHIGEDEHVERIYKACENALQDKSKVDCPICALETDGFSPDTLSKGEKDTAAHLFRVVFNTNICWVNEDGAVNLDECVSEPVKEFKNKIFAVDSETERGKVLPENMLALKIALLTQGVNFVADDPDELRNRVRPATNDAVDMLFGSKYYGAVINAPLNNKFQLFSPFDLKEIDAASMKFKLYYYGEEITEVTLYKTDPLEFNYDGSLRKTRDGRYTYRDVAYLSTDRLRVHVTNKCIYKTRSENGKSKSCKFCNIMPSCEDINLNAIKEVVSEHWKQHEESGLTHFLIGGQSPVQNQETIDNIVSIIKIIKDIREGGDPNIPPTLIYAMILPCGKESIEKMVTAGLTHLSFNIEIFDDKCAKKYMPGKGSISRETYKKSLLDALCVYMNDKKPEKREEAYKAVRSMVILGLEPEETFMEGMRWMIKEHIQPIISIFRPLNGTELSNLVAPSMISVYNIFFRLQKMINDKNGYSQNDNKVRYCFLGPDCRYCQNNTLSLPLDIKL